MIKYNKINQDAQIENTGLSLTQAANDLTASLVASATKRKIPLGSKETVKEDEPTVSFAAPQVPAGTKVAPCGDFGAVAYFTALPKGVTNMAASGPVMAAALSKRFNSRHVGINTANGVQLPEIATDLGCGVSGDILVGSPIFITGFGYGETSLPDPRKATTAKLVRDITLPCPSGLTGVVKREQTCELESLDDETKFEDSKVVFGGKRPVRKSKKGLASTQAGSDVDESGTSHEVRRMKRTWNCTPDLAALPPPTAAETASYCRDPADDITKPADQAISLTTDNLKNILSGSGPNLYTFKCQDAGNGNCIASPWTGPGAQGPESSNITSPLPANTFLRCDKNAIPEQYVINPIIPIQLDGAGKVMSETPAATKTGTIIGNRDCGQNWYGDLIAGYQVRSCNLIKSVNGVETILKTAQTIYRIGYVGARCKQPPKEVSTYFCPRPYKGQLTMREENYMLKPLALQLGTSLPATWTPSTIPWMRIPGLLGNANAETMARAAKEGYKVSRRPLEGVQNPDFTSFLEGVMQPDMVKQVTGCKLAGQGCELPPSPIKLGIVFDRSDSMTMQPQPVLTSATSRMSCVAPYESIFTDKAAACDILRNHADGSPVDPTQDNNVVHILQSYLIDPSNNVYINMMMDAIDNNRQCGETTTDQVGYCTPGDGAGQSSCAPGTCVSAGTVSGNKLRVAEDQLKTAIDYIPPGSEFKYTEYISDVPSTKGTTTLCNYVTDPNCNFASELGRVRDMVDDNNGLAKGGTPLMEAARIALEQFGDTYPNPNPVNGILMFFTDGEETDGLDTPVPGRKEYGNNYQYRYGSLCRDISPDNNAATSEAGLCRTIGITEDTSPPPTAAEAALIFSSFYNSENCAQNGSTSTCTFLEQYYDGTTLSPNWINCLNVGTQSRPSFVNYIRQYYPNLKVFILNLTSSSLNSCPTRDPQVEMIDVSDARGFQTAFARAFGSLNTRPATPEDVCQRMRATYPGAASY